MYLFWKCSDLHCAIYFQIPSLCLIDFIALNSILLKLSDNLNRNLVHAQKLISLKTTKLEFLRSLSDNIMHGISMFLLKFRNIFTSKFIGLYKLYNIAFIIDTMKNYQKSILSDYGKNCGWYTLFTRHFLEHNFSHILCTENLYFPVIWLFMGENKCDSENYGEFCRKVVTEIKI